MHENGLEVRSESSQRTKIWHTLRMLIGYLAEFRMRIAFACLFLVVAKLSVILVPIALKGIVDEFDASVNPDLLVAVPIALILAYGLLSLLGTLFEELRNALFSRASQRAVRNVGLQVFEHLHKLSHAFHQDRETGGISRDIERGTRGINFLLWYVVFSIVPTMFEIFVICIFLGLNFDFVYVVIAGGSIALYCTFTYYVTRWRTKFRVRMNNAETRANSVSVDALLNYETVKYFGNEKHEHGRFDTHMREWERQSVISEQTLALLNIGQGLIISAALIALLLMAGQDVVAGVLTLGDFVMLNAFLMQMFIPLRFLGTTFREINHSLTDMERMFNLLHIRDFLPEPDNAPALAIGKASIRFENVSFGYSPQRTILKNLSFEIPSGCKVAVVGKSGSGKSTIVRLLFRFYDTDSGRITIDGQDTRDVSAESLHAAIGIVPQDTVLFNDTIAYNIRYGQPQSTEMQFAEAVEQANLKDFIENLPEKFETVVGERGLKLSGGEKQRVSIARTILKDPPILVLDEATSSLDSKSERHIQNALDIVAKNRTTLVIAHRLSTIADADDILVLDSGEIAERGTHRELLERKGLFAEMWWLQQVEETEAKLTEMAQSSPLASA